jgi:hypothetical protein
MAGRNIAICIGVSVLCSVTGCSTTRRITNTSATGLQQLLTTEAVDRALQKLVWPDFSNRTVYVETGSPAEWGDQFYLNQAVTAHLTNQGAAVTLDPKAADYVVSVLAGAIGTDQKDVLVGMPPVASYVFPVALPEIAIYKAEDQEGFAKIELVASDAKRGGIVHRSGPAYGHTYVHNRTVLFIGWYTTDTSRNYQ